MMNDLQKSRDSLRRFVASESGSSTVEAVLWVPIFFFFTLFVLDASMMFNAQSRALQMVHDTNRALAVGRILSESEAEAQLRIRIAAISPSATVDSTISDGIVQSTVQMPISEISVFRTFDAFSDFSVTATSQQLLEN
jgi:Flp pilus assembly protein TadG